MMTTVDVPVAGVTAVALVVGMNIACKAHESVNVNGRGLVVDVVWLVAAKVIQPKN